MLFLNYSPGALSSPDLWSEFYIRVTQEKGWTRKKSISSIILG